MRKPPRSIELRLEDVREQIAIAREAVRRSTLADAIADPVYRNAIERCVSVISEALRHVPDDLTRDHAHVPWSKIRGIGNIIRHDYERIDPGVLHDIVLYELDSLDEACATLLMNLPR